MNGTETDAVAVLVLGDVPRRAIYVRAHETGVMTSIPVGLYRLQFRQGNTWLKTRRFCEVTATSEFTDAIEFYETQEGFNNIRVTLHPVPTGTARTMPLSAGSFRLPPEEDGPTN
jgi:hypothetical protein